MKHFKHLVFIGAVLGAVLSAQAQAVWTLRNSAIPIRTLRAVTTTGTQLVAVGDTGTVLVSSTGAAWTSRPTGTTSILFSVASGPNLLVAVGGAGVIRTSPDGQTWSAQTSTVTTAFYGVAHGTPNGVSTFVAVGAAGKLIVSTNGTEWVSRVSGVTGTLRAITWANGQFLAVGDGGIVSSSTDGVTWSGRTMGTGITTSYYGVSASGGLFIAVGGSGSIRTSTDGAAWTAQNSTVTSILNAVHRADGLWIVAGDGGIILTSPDGAAWTSRTSTTSSLLAGVASLGATRVVVGGAGTVRVSSDGTTWTNPLAGAANMNSVTFEATKGFVAVGDAGNALTSSDGFTWTKRNLANTVSAAGVMATGGSYIAVGAGGMLQASSTGTTWALGASGTPKSLFALASSGTFHVAVGADGKYVTSPDGLSWTERTSPVATNLYSVTYGNGQFVAVGAGGVILTSSSGTSWVSRGSSAFTGVFNSVTWAESQSLFVAVGAGAIYTSPNGTTWTPRTSPVSSTTLYGVASTGAFITAVGANGTLLASSDGIVWKPQISSVTTSLYSIAASDSLIVVVGVGGVVLSAPKAMLPAVPAQVAPANLATGVSVFPNLTWSAAAHATSYRVQVATDSNFASPLFNDSVAGTSWNSQLAGNSTFYWRVAGVSSLGSSAYSTKRAFTTGAAPTAPPATPGLISPALFATGVAIPTTLTWSASTGAEFYRVQVSTTPAFSTFVLNDSMVTTTSRQLTNLVGGTSYYWRVSARNGLGSSAFPEAFMFQTLLSAPAKPTLLTPAPFSTEVNRATSMTWSAVSGATTYRIQISLASDFSTLLLQDSTMTTASYKPPSALAAQTNFFWRVNAKNSAGTSEWSTAATFKTGTTSSLASGPRLASFTRLGGNDYLRFSLTAPGRVSVRVYDSQGRLIARVLDENRGGGEHTLRLPVGVGSGLHFLEFRSGEGREWLKIHP